MSLCINISEALGIYGLKFKGHQDDIMVRSDEASEGREVSEGGREGRSKVAVEKH